MKTKNLLASMFMVSVSAALVVGCQNKTTEPTPTPVPPITETVEKVSLLPEFGITMADICNHAGEYSIEFTPNADWSFASETSWLEVVTKSGTANDKVLKIVAKESNTAKTSRNANTKLTVGGREYPLTITQMGDKPEIKIFSKVVELSSRAMSGEIRNIIANCDIEVSSAPEWVSNIQVVAVEPGYRYSITFDLTENDYDTKAREGYVIIKDKASDYTYDVLIKCRRFTEAGFVDPSSAERVSSTPVQGVTDEERTFQITYYNNPTNDEDADPLTLALFMREVNDYNQQVTYTKMDGVVARVTSISPRAAFDVVNFKVTLPKFKNPIGGYGYKEIQVALFPVVESEADFFDPVTAEVEPSVIVTQKMAEEAKPLYNLNQIKVEYQKELKSPFILKYLVRNSVVKYGLKVGNDNNDAVPFTVSEPTEKGSHFDGWKEVTYEVTYDPTVVVDGLVNPWDAKTFYATLYTGEFTNFTTEKAQYQLFISTSPSRWIEAPDVLSVRKSNNINEYELNVVVNAVDEFDAATAIEFSGKVWDADADDYNGAEVDLGPDYEYPGAFTFASVTDLGALQIATYKLSFNPGANYKLAFDFDWLVFSDYKYWFKSKDSTKKTDCKITVEN